MTDYICYYIFQCDGAASARSFIGQIFSSEFETPQIMLIGADCSVATEPVAEISHNWNLVQVSFQQVYV